MLSNEGAEIMTFLSGDSHIVKSYVKIDIRYLQFENYSKAIEKKSFCECIKHISKYLKCLTTFTSNMML